MLIPPAGEQHRRQLGVVPLAVVLADVHLKVSQLSGEPIAAAPDARSEQARALSTVSRQLRSAAQRTVATATE
jgi:hypothetical protein